MIFSHQYLASGAVPVEGVALLEEHAGVVEQPAGRLQVEADQLAVVVLALSSGDGALVVREVP